MTETLFFHTYYAFLQGDLERTRMYYSMLQEEFNSRGNRHALETHQFKKLKDIRDAVNTGSIKTAVWVPEDQTCIENEKEEIDKQISLVKHIHYDSFNLLKFSLGSNDSFEIYNVEHPCGPYGRVDMVYRDSECMYPVEVKKHEGRHDLIGQISKYALYFKMHLHLKMYKRVQPVTICKCYDRHTLSELKRIEIIPLRYTVDNKKVILEKA